MPHLDKITRFEITPEQFLKACSQEEIIELNLLLQSAQYQTVINQLNLFENIENEVCHLSHFKHAN